MYKPAGITSFGVVAVLRRLFKQKTGHTGTLDPMAEGVLPICLGSATKLAQLMSESDKEYLVEVVFGSETDTQDATGTVTAEKPLEADEAAFITALNSFKGSYEQMPPMYSAIKVQGRKLYELARKGIEVERASRAVRINRIEVKELDLPRRAVILVSCSKGAYMRTLCYDLGKRLYAAAHMGRLVRTEAAGFGLNNAVELEYIKNMDADELRGVVIPAQDIPALRGLASATIKPEFTKRLHSGGVFSLDDVICETDVVNGQRILMRRACGGLAAVYTVESADNRTKPRLKPFIMLNHHEQAAEHEGF